MAALSPPAVIQRNGLCYKELFCAANLKLQMCEFMKTTVLGCVAGMLAIGNVLAGDLIVNGSFEDPNVAFNSYSIYDVIPGWTGVGRGIEIQDHASIWSGTPFLGDQFVELDSWSNSGMFQTVTTTPGGLYELTFAYSPRPRVGADSNPINVYFDGVFLESLTGQGGVETSWSVHHYMVTPIGSTATVLFEAGGVSDAFGGYIDDVRLSVPDAASSFMLLGSSFILLSVLRLKLKPVRVR